MNTVTKVPVKHLPSDYPKDVPANWSPITTCLVGGESWVWPVADNKDFVCPKHSENAQVVEEDESEGDYIPGYDDGEAEPSDDEETSFE
jgi:hypothetical protein